MEEAFPCPLELTVASALLLLSTSPFSFSIPMCESKSSSSESLLPSDCKPTSNHANSRASSSTLTSDDGSSPEAQAHRLRMVAVVARFNEIKQKVIRKKRSQSFSISYGRRLLSEKPVIVSSGCASESSCLSSGSSALSCNVVSDGIGERNSLGPTRNLKRKPVNSVPLRHRAEDIMRVLSQGSSSEIRIRQLLGDSPDTSKALRLLLKREEVKRSGAGGRGDPFIYMIAPKYY